MEIVLVSIKSKWWEKIRSGEKTVEVRKSCPFKVKLPFRILWYETGGVGIVGESVCEEIIMRHEHSYDSLTEGSCLALEDIKLYGKGKALFGWCVSKTITYDVPVPLWIRPPQSWQYLTLGWVSAKDRLPLKGVTDPLTNDYVDFICTLDFGKGRIRRLARYDSAGRWVFWGSDYTENVIAWMPMPLPYHQERG